MKKILLLLIAFSGFALAAGAQRYAIIDTKSILSKIPEYKEADKKLQLIGEQWQKDIDDRQGILDKMYKNYEAAQFMLTRPGQFKIVGKPYKVNLVGYPLTKGSTERKAAVDKIIGDARADGTLNKMAKSSFDLDAYDAALPPVGQDAKF